MFINNKTIEILKRAFPHLDNTRQRPISVILKIAELNDSIEQFTHPVHIESCDNSNSHINTEELLRSIKPLCSKKEQDVIDFALNFNKTKDIYNAYKAFNGDNTNPKNSDTSDTSLNNKLGFLKNNLSSEQLDTINQLNNLINN